MKDDVTSRKSRKKGKKVLVWTVAGVLVVGGALGYWMYGGSVNADQAGTTIWTTADTGTIQQKVSLSGTLNPSNQVTLTSSGKVVSVSVHAGEKVKKGQVIAKVDTSSLETQLTINAAQLRQAEEKLSQTEETTTTTDNRGNSVSKAPDPYAVDQAEESVTQARAQYDSVLQQIHDSTLTSPIAGVVLQITDPNNQTSTSSSSSTSSGNSGNGSGSSSSSGSGGAGNTVAVISDLSPNKFSVDASVPQSDAANIKVGQKAEIQLSSDSSTTLTGVVKDITLIPQTSSGVTTYPITIQVDKPKDGGTTLLPGTSVTVDVLEKQVNNVVRIPTAALTQRGSMTGVYVQASGSTSSDSTSQNAFNRAPAGLRFVPVTVGLYGGQYVEVKSGLKAGDKVAIYMPITQSTSNNNGGQGGGLGGGAMFKLGGSGQGRGNGGGQGFGGGGQSKGLGGGSRGSDSANGGGANGNN